MVEQSVYSLSANKNQLSHSPHRNSLPTPIDDGVFPLDMLPSILPSPPFVLVESVGCIDERDFINNMFFGEMMSGTFHVNP
jgi:hypothetical protein